MLYVSHFARIAVNSERCFIIYNSLFFPTFVFMKTQTE